MVVVVVEVVVVVVVVVPINSWPVLFVALCAVLKTVLYRSLSDND